MATGILAWRYHSSLAFTAVLISLPRATDGAYRAPYLTRWQPTSYDAAANAYRCAFPTQHKPSGVAFKRVFRLDWDRRFLPLYRPSLNATNCAGASLPQHQHFMTGPPHLPVVRAFVWVAWRPAAIPHAPAHHLPARGANLPTRAVCCHATTFRQRPYTFNNMNQAPLSFA